MRDGVTFISSFDSRATGFVCSDSSSEKLAQKQAKQRKAITKRRKQRKTKK